MTTSNFGTLSSRLVNPSSFHPTVHISLDQSQPLSRATRGCQAGVLIHLPSGVFYDPHTAHHAADGQATVLTSSNDGNVELEAAVGYTTRARRQAGRQWWERPDDDPRSSGEGVGGLDLSMC